MTFDEPGPRRRRGQRFHPGLAVVYILCASSAAAEEPLFLRIRPQPRTGSAGAADAAREAIWTRSQTRARAAIASVCTGCLGVWRMPLALVAADRGSARPDDRVATLAASTGLEPDPVSGASDTATEQPIREERP